MLDKKVEIWYNNRFAARPERERAATKKKREFPLSIFYGGTMGEYCGKQVNSNRKRRTT